MPLRSGQEVLRYIERWANDVDLVSFDVFDTLLGRRIAPPELTKVPTAHCLKSLLAERGIVASVRSLVASRTQAELSLRQRALRQGLDPECRIRELILEWIAQYIPGSEATAVADRLHDVELATEKEVTFAVAGMKQAVQRARELEKEVVFISDMYLSGSDVRSLLRHNGFDGLFDGGYVSSDALLSKGSGRLFEQVQLERRAAYNRWLHVGDNRRADVSVPRRRLGIRTARFAAPNTVLRTARITRAERLVRAHSRWQGLPWLELCRNDHRDFRGRDPRYTLGYWVLGPLLATFMHRVVRWTASQQVDLILFPAREGFLLQRLYDTLAPVVAPAARPRVEYAFLNRKSVYSATSQRLDPRHWTNGTNRPTLAKLLRRYGMEVGPFQTLAARCGIQAESPLVLPAASGRLRRFLTDPQFEAAWTEQRAAERELLDDYLGQLGFWEARRACLVDVGWQGTVQQTLTAGFADHPNWPGLRGVYLAMLDERADPTNRLGLLYHHGQDPLGSGSSAAYRFLELLEVATRAPHASVDGLRREASGRVVPILKDPESAARQAELRDQGYVVSLQQGVFDFLDAYVRLLPFTDGEAEPLYAVAVELFGRLIRYPKRWEAEALLPFSHSEDFGSDELVQSREDFRRTWLQRWTLLSRRHHIWRDGRLALQGSQPLASLGNLGRLLLDGAQY